MSLYKNYLKLLIWIEHFIYFTTFWIILNIEEENILENIVSNIKIGNLIILFEFSESKDKGNKRIFAL